MTQFTQKTFTVKTGQRDTCPKGHWPKRDNRGGYECVFCGKRCTVDGQTLNEKKTA